MKSNHIASSASFCTPPWGRRLSAILRPGIAGLAVLTFAACSSDSPTCEDMKGDYRLAKDAPALSIPEGMASPDRSAALVVPPVSKASSSGRGTCLESPPSYFGTSGRIAITPEQIITSWAQDWADRNADAVLTLYSENFVAPAESGRGPWLDERREQIVRGPVPDAKLEDLKVRDEGNKRPTIKSRIVKVVNRALWWRRQKQDARDEVDNRRIVSFTQHFGDHALRKELTLVREGGSWRIVSERVLDVD